MKRKLILILSILLAASLFITACAEKAADKTDTADPEKTVAADPDKPEEPAEPEPDKPDEPADPEPDEPAEPDPDVKTSLVYGIGSEPRSLDPSNANDLVSYMPIHQMFNFLIDYRADGTLAPGLAESWDLSEDGTELTFHLREGVKFHNGDDLTAEDVEFSLNNAIQSPHTASISTAMDHAEVVDDKTVKLVLKHAFGPIEYCVAHSQMGIVNKKAYEEDPDKYGVDPIGTGPYKLVEWRSGDQLILEAFEDYYKGPAAIKDLTIKIIIEPGTRTIALETGEIDILEKPQDADRTTLMENENIQYHEIEEASTVFVAFNNAEGRFTDKTLRQAIAHAVDKEAMIIGAVNGIGTAIETPMASSVFGWSEGFQNREYDVERAKELLAEAGYPDGFSMQMKTMEGPTYLKPSEVFQEQLRAIGIDAELNVMERGAFLQDVNQNQDYEMCILALSVPYPDADYIYALFHGSLKGQGRNFFNADSPELNDLLERARLETDQEVRKDLYLQISEYFYDDPIMVPLYSYMTSFAAHKDLKGVQANPLVRCFIYDLSW